jgi:hypothetical protein
MRMTYCKIFCVNDFSDLKEIQSIISCEKKIRIVTESTQTKNSLKKNGISSYSLEDIFPVYSNLNFLMYNKTKEQILKYQQGFDKIKLKDHDIVTGLIHYAKNDILFIEKAKHVLEDKIDTVWIFEKFNKKYFVLKKIAEELEYNSSIYLQDRHKLTELNNSDSTEQIERSNQILRYKKAFSSYSRNIASSSPNRISLWLKLVNKIIPVIFHIIASKVRFSSDETIESVLKNINKKLEKYTLLQYGFFLSSDRQDLLDSYLQICKKFIDNNINFLIFTIDPITLSFLDNKRFPIMDLSQEIFELSNTLKRISEAKTLEEQLIKASKEMDFSLLFLNNFNLELMNGVYRTVATSIILERVLEKTKVKNSIFIDGTMLGLAVASLSKKTNIHTSSIETLIVDDNAISSILYKADKICIYGKQGKETLQSFGILDDRILVTGNPKYDYIASIDPEKSKALLSK